MRTTRRYQNGFTNALIDRIDTDATSFQLHQISVIEVILLRVDWVASMDKRPIFFCQVSSKLVFIVAMYNLPLSSSGIRSTATVHHDIDCICHVEM